MIHSKLLMKQRQLRQMPLQAALQLRRLLQRQLLQRHLLLQLPPQLPLRQPVLPQMRQPRLLLPKFPIQNFRLQPMRRLQRLPRLQHQKRLQLRRLLLLPMMQYQEPSLPMMQRK
jgi:hypothetical protein